MSWQHKTWVMAVLLLVSACGFKPVYKDYGKDNPALSTELAAVEVTPLKADRHEQELTSELEDLLNPTRNATPSKYVLSIALERLRDASVIQRNREITRYSVTVKAKYVLRDKSNGKVMKNGASIMSASYDAIASDFANYTAEEDTVSKIMKEMAKDIRFQLTTEFLDKQKK
jgi:LPS-assembly lipoprotein